jgi:hypothetical protein
MKKTQSIKLISLMAIVMLFAVSVFAQTIAQRGVAKALPAPPAPCPGPFFNPFGLPNMLKNFSFNTVGPSGTTTTHSGALPVPLPPSAAQEWLMHNNNFGATITTRMIPSTGPQGPRMLHIRTGGTEGGVMQNFTSKHKGTGKIVGAVWVFVNKGKVQLGIHADGSPTASVMSTKIGQWELLKVCSDGNSANSIFFVLNQDPDGGDFFIDAAAVVRGN